MTEDLAPDPPKKRRHKTERVKHDLTYHARVLFARMAAERATLRLELGRTQEQGTDGKLFWIDPSGKRVGNASAEELIRKGKVVPLGDGLFDEPQSWGLP